MTKKGLNQNGIYVQKLIDTIETEFIFANDPINRFGVIESNKNNIIKDKLEQIITVSKAQEFILNSNGIKNTLTINNGISECNDSINLNQIEEFKHKYNNSD